MLIANPIYDSVFKFLLEDLHIAKRFLSVIIGEEIIELDVRPQELSAPSNKYLLTIFRLDFKAIIKTKTGATKKVLIELQKSKNAFDIQRFRHYLGSNYMRPDELDELRMTLPILPIYFIGFPLSIKRPVIKVNRHYEDAQTGEVLDTKDEFIENLTHDCFVVQVKHLPEEAKTKLEKLLSFFNQKLIFDPDQKWLIKYDANVDDEDQRLILNRLAYAAESEDVKDQIEVEETFDLSMDSALREKERIIAEKEEEINFKDEVISRKDEVISRKDEELLRLKNEAEKEKEDLLKQLAEMKHLLGK